MPLNHVKAVSLDFTGTLASPYPFVGKVYANALTFHGLKSPSPAVLDLAFNNALATTAEPPQEHVNEANWRTYWENLAWNVLKPYCPQTFYPTLFETLWKHFGQGRHWKPKPLAKEILQLLNVHGYRVVLLSNWDMRLHKVIRDLGWTHFFQNIFLSTEIGTSKPHANTFSYVQNVLKLEARQMLHIGNHFQNDYLGARRQDWNAMLFTSRPDLFSGAHCIHQLWEVMPMLLKSKGQRGSFFSLKTQNLIHELKNLPHATRYKKYNKKSHSLFELIEPILESFTSGAVQLEQKILEQWIHILGSRFAHRCKPHKIIDGTRLVLLTDSPTVRQEVQFNKQMILKNIQKIPGCECINDLVLRAG